MFIGIGLSAQPFINVTYPNGNCGPAKVDFKLSNAPGAAQHYYWYFSDGGTAYYGTGTDTASHIFPGGNWYVTVDVYDVNWNYLYYTYEYFNLIGASQLYTSPYDGKVCPNDFIEIYMPGQSSGGYFTWDFGDLSPIETGNNSGINHAYSTPGIYTVTCNASFSGCPGTVLSTTIDVNNSVPVTLPIPGISAFPYTACVGDNINIQFPGSMSNGSSASNYYVDFGDGNNSTTTLDHSYNFVGTYPIYMSLVNGCGNSATFNTSVTISNNVQILSTPYFNNGAYNICPATEAYFGAPPGFSQYNWVFGNGQTATVANPKTTYYTLGDFEVRLTVTNGCGYTKDAIDTAHVVSTVTVSSPSINMPDSICPGDGVLIDFNSNGASNYTYDLGNGQMGSVSGSNNGDNNISTYYSTTGTYTVNVTATNGCGNSAVGTQTLVVIPNAPMQSNAYFFEQPTGTACPGDTTFFVFAPANLAAYNVDFGDGSPIATTPSFILTGGPGGSDYAIFQHAYATVGTYTATGTVFNSCGNSSTKPKTIDIYSNSSLEEADLFYDDQKYNCMQDPITFMAYGGTKYIWNFGDGTPAITTTNAFATIDHTFPWAGFYTLSIIVENGCGITKTITKEVNVQYSYIGINTNQVASTCHLSNGKAIAVVNYAANSPVTFSWTNGDQTAIADSVAAGLYEVTVTDNKGCESRALATVSDAQGPTITTGAIVQVSCHGGSDGAIDINLIGGASPYTYAWSNGAQTQDVNNLIAGPYEVVITDANGCKSTKTFTIYEPQGFSTNFQVTAANCNIANGAINAVVTPANTYYYIWSNGMSTANIMGLGAGVYHLTVVDANGCLDDQNVIVNNIGGPNVAIDSISSVNCLSAGNNIYTSIYPGGAAGPYTYQWLPGNITTSNLLNVPTGTYSLMVTGAGNCKTYKSVAIEDELLYQNPVCLVTVDTTTRTNLVVWEEVPQANLASFNIYRESSQAGLYYLVANVHKDSLHQYTDPVADPNVRGWRYKIASVSTCGTESFQSAFHKTIHLTANKGLGNTYNLIWDDYIGKSYSTFYIWRFTNLAGWQKIDSLSSNNFSWTDTAQVLIGGLTDLNYMIEAGPISSCDPSRGVINTTRSNIKSAKMSTVGIISRIEIGDDLWVYPNPTSGMITLKFENTPEEKTYIEVINLMGESLIVDQMSSGTVSKNLDLSSLTSGIYIIRTISGDKQNIKRIVLTK